MADPRTDAPALDRCPWCSAPLPDPTAETCPSCGATLTSAAPADGLPGVTTLDTEAILRARSAVSRPRSRLLSFITGEPDEGPPSPLSAESLAPPSEEVRREMLRMEIAAEVADLEAEVQSLETEARLEAGQPLVETPGAEEPAAVPAAAEAPAATPPEADVDAPAEPPEAATDTPATRG